jgi:rod shape-determining protein MreD
MITTIPRYIGLFILLLFVQIFLLNNIHFLGFVNPYLYILFILIFPLNAPRPVFLIVAFLLGFTLDIFCNTLGIHAFASVFAAFIRPYVMSLYIPRDNHDYVIPSVATFGEAAFIKYAVTLVLAHHFVLFLMEAFSFQNFGVLLLKILLNSALTIVLVISIERYKRR